MLIYKNKYSILYKAITTVLACLFFANSVVLANPDTLAPLAGSPKVYQAMRSMMEERLIAHQEPVDEFIKQHANTAKGLSAIPHLEEEFMGCIEASNATNMLTRLKTTLTSAGGRIQVIFVKSENELPSFDGKRAWGHAGTYVTVFALEGEKDSKEGRLKIIGRLFHEIRARSTRAKELFDEKLKTETPTTPEEISAFVRSMRENFEKDNHQLQQQIEQNNRITNLLLASEFANLTFAIHPDVMNRDYMMAKKLLPIPELMVNNVQIDGVDYAHELQRILQYRVYDVQLLNDIIVDLNLTLKSGVNSFKKLIPKRQMDIYNLASLLGLNSKLRACGVNEEVFSFAPGSGISMGNDINTRFSRGYEVSIGSTWSRLKPADYCAISKIQELNFPTNKASVLNLCGGNGHPLLSIAPAFQSSRLVMVDANSKNISNAMQQMDKVEDSNTYEVKLSDVRSGFGGIPCADQEFDVVTMVGDSEFGMSFDDLYRLMSESIRVLKHNGGLFLIETTHIERYVSALQQLVQENRSSFDFDIGMHQLAEGVFVIVTGKLSDDKKPSTTRATTNGSNSNQLAADNANPAAGNEGPALFIDPRGKKEVRSLTDDEHRILNDALNHLAFEYPEEGAVEFLSDEKTRKLLGYELDETEERAPPEIRVIEDAALLRMLPNDYKYLADGLITHAGTWRTDPLGHKHANIFLTRSVYEMLNDYATNYSRHEFRDFWRAHELKHLAERTVPLDTVLEEREKWLAVWFYEEHRKNIDNKIAIDREREERHRKYSEDIQENADVQKAARILGGFSEYTEAFELKRLFNSVGATETAIRVLEGRLSNPYIKNSDVIKEYEVQRELVTSPESLKALNQLLGRLDSVLGELQGEIRSFDESQQSYDAMTECFKRLLYPETGELPTLLKELDVLLARYSNPYAVELKEAVSQSLKNYSTSFFSENTVFKRHEYKYDAFGSGLYSNAPKLDYSQHDFLRRLNDATGEIAASAVLATLRVERGYKEAVFTKDGSLFTMQNAIHPTLKIKDKFEPVSFTVPREGKAVLISGLNTGGKSVTLKTVGIIALMTQCGIPVPADVTIDEGMFTGFVKPDISHYDVNIGEASRFAAELATSGYLLKTLSPRMLTIIDDDMFGGSSEPAIVASYFSATVEGLSERNVSVIAVTHHIDALEALRIRHPDYVFKRIKTIPGKDGEDVSTRSLEDGIAGSSQGLNETVKQKWPAASSAVAFYNMLRKTRGETELSYQGVAPLRSNKPARYRGFFYSNAERANLQTDRFADVIYDVARAILGGGCAYEAKEFASRMMRKPETCDASAWRASIQKLKTSPDALRFLDEKLRANMPEWEHKENRSPYGFEERSDYIVDEGKLAVKRFLDLVEFAVKSDIPLISENGKAIKAFIDDKRTSADFMRSVESYGLEGAFGKVEAGYSGPEKDAKVVIVNNIRALFCISSLAHISWPFASSNDKRGLIHIEGGWHSALTKDPLRTPNDIAIDLNGPSKQEGSLTIYTGFNTGGKSTLAKMIAEIVTLARMGWPVPASSADIGEFSDIQVVSGTLTEDKQQTRSHKHKDAIGGALAAALHESALVLQSSTPKTLVILDEPFSGCTEPSVSAALTAALSEELVKKGATVILITHLLESVPLLTERIPYARTFKAKTTERDGLTVPLYHFEPGTALSSHGFEVARGMKWPGYDRALGYFALLSKEAQIGASGHSQSSEDTAAISSGLRSSPMGATDALSTLPQEWHGNDLKAAEFIVELSHLLQIENIIEQDKSTFIFSEKVTFGNGLGILLPKLAKSGMRVAVIATNDRQRALIDELNNGKPENEIIIYADTVADIRTKVHSARYYYFKVTGDPDTDLQGIATFDITEIVKKIIDALGKISGIMERERLELLHEAARKFAEAA